MKTSTIIHEIQTYPTKGEERTMIKLKRIKSVDIYKSTEMTVTFEDDTKGIITTEEFKDLLNTFYDLGDSIFERS